MALALTAREEERAAALYREAAVVNMCNNSTLNDLDDTWRSGITCTMVTPSAAAENFRDTIEKMYGTNDSSVIESVRRAPPDKVSQAFRAADIREAKAEGKVTVMIGFQNANALEQDLNFVDLFYALGVRSMGIAYNYRNHWGDGCTERNDAGLSTMGLELIKKLNQIGMLVDLSHASRQTCIDALETSTSPVIFSHSNARGLVLNDRNVDDDVLKMLADQEGVIGVTAFPSYVKWENPTIEDMLDHIDHIAKLIGPEHIGFGLDLIEGYPNDRYARADGSLRFGKLKSKPGLAPPWPWKYPEGLSKRSECPNLARGLVQRGYRDEAVLGILGGNFLRIIERVVG